MEDAIVSNPIELSGFVINEAGFDLAAMRPVHANSLLRKDDWKVIDNTVYRIVSERLVGVQDLLSRGLVFDAGDLGTTIAEWETSGDMADAEISMSGRTRSQLDSAAYELAGVPIPIIHKGFSISERRLLASRRNGGAVDTLQAAVAARKVAEKSEAMLFGGANIKVGGYTIPGYTTVTGRATGSLTAAWTDTANRTPIQDVIDMISDAEDIDYYGPYMLYVDKAAYAAARDDYKTNSEKSFLAKIREFTEIVDVRPSARLSAGSAVLVQLSPEVVDIARVIAEPTTLQWDRGLGEGTDFKVMAAWAPRIKRDQNGNVGIVHYTA